MTTLTINRKPEGVHGRPQENAQTAAQRDKTTTAHKVAGGEKKPQQKPAGAAQQPRTTRRQRKNHRRIMRLVEAWPELFNPETPKPLKVEVFDDLMADVSIRGLSFGQGALRAAVSSYAQSPRYLRVLMAGGARHDLKGQPCGEVTAEEQEAARTRLMVLNEKRKRQAAQEKAGA
ncbi:TPA: ProQ/FinO family protein [Escherichia coli]|nr:ProQ/FinO family protein [Escherichia coli]